MKKMYFLTIALILLILSGFLLFYNDTDALSEHFLAEYGIITDAKPDFFEEFTIPNEFDEYYTAYNMMQIECGLDLTPHCGKNAVKYTYRIMNIPQAENTAVYANVICVKGKPVAGDITCPRLNGFTVPLNGLESAVKFLNDNRG